PGKSGDRRRPPRTSRCLEIRSQCSVRRHLLAPALDRSDWGEWDSAVRMLCRRERAGLSTGQMGRPIRILGIDPGLRRTGWGLIEVEGNRLIYVACGSVATSDKLSLAERLVTIHDGLAKVIEEFAPEESAVEATFVNKDANATL